MWKTPTEVLEKELFNPTEKKKKQTGAVDTWQGKMIDLGIVSTFLTQS